MNRWRTCLRAGLIIGAAALATAAFAGNAAASVSSVPAKGTPQLYPNGTTEQVRQLVQCGTTMYAVGSFTKIQQGASGPVYTRYNVFSFNASSPYTVTSWAPSVNGKVNTIAFDGTNCATAYIGGIFSSVNGAAAKNIAAVSTSSGALVSGFAHNASAQVETIVSYHGHLLTGGYFGSVNGSSHRFMASLNPSTGRDDGFVNLNISGSYQYCNSAGTRCADGNATRVFNQQLSHGGTLDLVEGVFTSVGGQPRQQIFMLNLSGSSATVTPWYPTTFNQHCYFSEPFYLRSAAWSPDDATIYTATTGFHLYNWNGRYPQTGICDTAAAFSAAQTTVTSPRWINYTGCDSLYSAAADTTTAYFGGHERWSSNPNGCDFQGSGGIAAPGIEGLSPSTGALVFNPTRARGFGADDMLVTSAGLWIASDNFSNSKACAGVSGHAGICLLLH